MNLPRKHDLSRLQREDAVLSHRQLRSAEALQLGADIEIAAWKLANARDARGEPLLLSNEIAGDARNLSFEREFGKMIAYQDVMAQIAAQRTNRIIRRVVQTLATAVSLPI